MGRFVILPALAIACVTTVHAQLPPVSPLPPAAEPVQSEPAPQSRIFRSGASMVALSVTVLDGKKPVAGLAQQDFEVFEDGVQQSVRFFESRLVPLDVILLLDSSSSMNDKM